jgi:hypothetical protein
VTKGNDEFSFAYMVFVTVVYPVTLWMTVVVGRTALLQRLAMPGTSRKPAKYGSWQSKHGFELSLERAPVAQTPTMRAPVVDSFIFLLVCFGGSNEVDLVGNDRKV